MVRIKLTEIGKAVLMSHLENETREFRKSLQIEIIGDYIEIGELEYIRDFGINLLLEDNIIMIKTKELKLFHIELEKMREIFRDLEIDVNWIMNLLKFNKTRGE